LKKHFIFSNKWEKLKSREKHHAQLFVIELLACELLACFGVDAGEVGKFEEKAGRGNMDYLWPG
jgi:hypothetical protein